MSVQILHAVGECNFVLSLLFDSQHAKTVKFSGMAFEIQWMQFYKIRIRTSSYTLNYCTATCLNFTVEICRVRCRGFLRHLHHHWLDYVEKVIIAIKFLGLVLWLCSQPFND